MAQTRRYYKCAFLFAKIGVNECNGDLSSTMRFLVRIAIGCRHGTRQLASVVRLFADLLSDWVCDGRGHCVSHHDHSEKSSVYSLEGLSSRRFKCLERISSC